jgi:aminopeptidase-like protein
MKNLIELYFDKLFPINRSLTGDGNRESLKILKELVDLNITEVPSGLKCFDWKVPSEWNVNEAWIKDDSGNEIINFKKNNLHIVGYSHPIDKWLDYSELTQILHTLPNMPNSIPYVTSYYKKYSGFCLSHNALNLLDKKKKYHVYIDSNINNSGSMTIGEAILPGASSEEILFTTYICHPSMANNELSGPLVQSFLYQNIKKIKNRKYTYRFLYCPETIGSIYYISKNYSKMKKNILGGLVLTCLGDGGKLNYKMTKKGNSLIDRAVTSILEIEGYEHSIIKYFPMGSDERQYNSPGINIPIGAFMRTPYGEYPQYHTSSDDKSIISFSGMEKSVLVLTKICKLIENNYFAQSLNPNCEPMLGKRGLYPSKRSNKDKSLDLKSILWILGYADGKQDLIELYKKSKLPIKNLIDAANLLEKNKLINKLNIKVT